MPVDEGDGGAVVHLDTDKSDFTRGSHKFCFEGMRDWLIFLFCFFFFRGLLDMYKFSGTGGGGPPSCSVSCCSFRVPVN